jgi:hypothetical protein
MIFELNFIFLFFASLHDMRQNVNIVSKSDFPNTHYCQHSYTSEWYFTKFKR